MSTGGQAASTSQTRPYQGFPYTNPQFNDVPSINPNMTIRGHVASTSQTRPYQGFPYTNPQFNDVPSVNPATSQQWQNLPRTVISNKRTTENSRTPTQETNEDQSFEDNKSISVKSDDEIPPVIYVDLPEHTASQVIENRSDASQARSSIESYVQNTIFYDPFENRTISVAEEDDASAKSETQARPSRPTLSPLNLSSHNGESSSSANSYVPPFLANKTYVLGRQLTPDDGFSLTPLPVSDFPLPPPSYSEAVREDARTTRVVTEQPRSNTESQELPRTIVTVANERDGGNGFHRSQLSQPVVTEGGRKYLICQHCGRLVYTVMMRQPGAATHMLAVTFFIFCLLPLICVIYCTEFFKYRNHFCPSCNKLIGYEIPMLCQKLVYVS